jgi:hypothetical protein
VAEKAYCLSLKAFLINRLLRRPNALGISCGPSRRDTAGLRMPLYEGDKAWVVSRQLHPSVMPLPMAVDSLSQSSGLLLEFFPRSICFSPRNPVAEPVAFAIRMHEIDLAAGASSCHIDNVIHADSTNV